VRLQVAGREADVPDRVTASLHDVGGALAALPIADAIFPIPPVWVLCTQRVAARPDIVSDCRYSPIHHPSFFSISASAIFSAYYTAYQFNKCKMEIPFSGPFRSLSKARVVRGRVRHTGTEQRRYAV
jgi:hypothetical protein